MVAPIRAGAVRFYFALIIPMLIGLNVVFIPFHAPDDYLHFYRAYTLARGAVLPITEPGQPSGGMIDTGLLRYFEMEWRAVRNWPRQGHVAPDAAAGVVREQLRWTGQTEYAPLGGAAPYLPLIYAPQTVGIWVGEALGLTIEDTLLLARTLNGLSAVAILCLLLRVLPFGSATVLLLLLLPKTLLHFASNSPDPLLHAAALGMLVLACRTGRAPLWQWGLAGLALFVTLGLRPPLVALDLPLLWAAWQRRDWRGAGLVVAGTVLGVGWLGFVLPRIVDVGCGVSPPLLTAGINFLRDGALLIARSIEVHAAYYFKSFIGELGWGNGPQGRIDPLPVWVYAAATLLGLYALALDAAERFVLPRMERLVLLVAAAGMTLLTFFAMYISCTVPGAWYIGGVQGRYFVAVVFCLVPAIAGTLRWRVPRQYYLPLLFVFVMASYGTLMADGLRMYWLR